MLVPGAAIARTSLEGLEFTGVHVRKGSDERGSEPGSIHNAAGQGKTTTPVAAGSQSQSVVASGRRTGFRRPCECGMDSVSPAEAGIGPRRRQCGAQAGAE